MRRELHLWATLNEDMFPAAVDRIFMMGQKATPFYEWEKWKPGLEGGGGGSGCQELRLVGFWRNVSSHSFLRNSKCLI